MKFKIKNIIKTTMLFSMFCMFGLSLNLHVLKADIYYERIDSEIIGKGVSFTKKQQVTARGMLDIYILRAPLNDEYITIKPASSIVEFKLKESTTKILGDNGAIAGVNGDFFNMTGTHSKVQGPVVSDGIIISTDILNNMDANTYSAFFIDEDNNPFFDYIKTDLHFINNGVENIKVFEYNRLSDMVYSGYLDRNAMNDTSLVDRQFPNITKIVVEDGIITYISEKGETVEVPENGFIILISDESAEYFTTLVNVGETAEMRVSGSVDYSKLQTAIGGGGMILANGEAVNDGGFVPTGRQPRTAIGFNKERTEVILMVVDGRSHSIGATHSEMANILLQNGVYEAMHLDGGGSTAMGVKRFNDPYVQLVNTVSQGNQRRVANTIGIFNEAPVGELDSVLIKSNAQTIFRNTAVPMYIVGVDEYYNEIPIEGRSISTVVITGEGSFNEDVFYPASLGEIEILATIEDKIASKKFRSVELAEIIPNVSNLDMGIGGRTNLSFSGVSNQGNTAYIYSGLNFEVVPPELGTVENDVFIANSNGAGYIKAYLDDVAAYISVHVGFAEKQVTSFENDISISSNSYPNKVNGNAEFSNLQAQDKNYSVELTYKFEESTDMQSVYVDFNTPIMFNNGMLAFNVWVFGDDSYNWLRAKMTDESGKDVIVDLAKQIDWIGWRRLSVNIPEDVVYPLKLDAIYITSIGNSDTSTYTLFIDNLSVDEYFNYGAIELPPATKFSDSLQAALSNETGSGFDITLVGDMVSNGKEVPQNYNSIIQKVINNIKVNSSRVLFAGETQGIDDIGIRMYKWNTNYVNHSHENVAILQMSASNGGFINTNVSQWGRFSDDVIQSGADHVIIMIDISPLNFTNAREAALFQEALEDLSKSGKNIFVVSTEGTANRNELRNGIRYINMGGLFTSNNSENENFNMLRFRVEGQNIKYDFQKAT